MTENQSHPDDAQRPEGEPRFSFTDKRKVNPEDGSVRPLSLIHISEPTRPY